MLTRQELLLRGLQLRLRTVRTSQAITHCWPDARLLEPGVATIKRAKDSKTDLSGGGRSRAECSVQMRANACKCVPFARICKQRLLPRNELKRNQGNEASENLYGTPGKAYLAAVVRELSAMPLARLRKLEEDILLGLHEGVPVGGLNVEADVDRELITANAAHENAAVQLGQHTLVLHCVALHPGVLGSCATGGHQLSKGPASTCQCRSREPVFDLLVPGLAESVHQDSRNQT
jgi:hypothetical protein